MVSRYEASEIAELDVGGVPIRYLKRRFPPTPAIDRPGAPPPLATHRVRLGDRLDLISQTYLGDPLAYWIICDANAALDPDGLTAPDAEDSILVITPPER